MFKLCKVIDISVDNAKADTDSLERVNYMREKSSSDEMDDFCMRNSTQPFQKKSGNFSEKLPNFGDRRTDRQTGRYLKFLRN